MDRLTRWILNRIGWDIVTDWVDEQQEHEAVHHEPFTAYYVGDSGVNAEGYGLSPNKPFASLDYAAIQASLGDRIYVFDNLPLVRTGDEHISDIDQFFAENGEMFCYHREIRMTTGKEA